MKDTVDRVEKAVLALNREAERTMTNAQTLVEQNTGDPAPLRELAVYYRERIEILKPILAALKREIANREG